MEDKRAKTLEKLRRIAAGTDPILASKAKGYLAQLGDPMEGPGTQPMPEPQGPAPAPPAPQRSERAEPFLERIRRDNPIRRADEFLYKKAGQLGQMLGIVGGDESTLDAEHAEMADNPGKTLANLTNRVANTVTAGAYNALLDPISRTTGVPFVPPLEERDRFASEHPFMTGATDAVAGSMGAPVRVAGAVAGPVAKVTDKLGGLLGPIAQGAATGAATGGIVSGTTALGDGRPLDEVIDRTTAGMKYGGGFGAGAGAFRSGSNAIAGAKKIKTYLDAKNRGEYEVRPELKAKGDDDLADVAIKARGEIAKRTNAAADADTEMYGQVEKALSESGKRVRVAPLVDELKSFRDSLVQESGAVLPDKEALYNALGKQIASLTPKKTPSMNWRSLPAEEVLKIRQSLKSSANLDGKRPDDASSVVYKEIYAKFNEALQKAVPEIRQADAVYSAGSERLKRINDIVYGQNKRRILGENEDGEMVGRTSTEAKGALKLLRVANDTQPGYVTQDQFRQLQRLDPEIAAQVDDVRVADAYRGTRFGLPMDKAMGGVTGVVGHNLRALGARPVYSTLNAGDKAAAAVSRAPMTLADAKLERAKAERKRKKQEKR